MTVILENAVPRLPAPMIKGEHRRGKMGWVAHTIPHNPAHSSAKLPTSFPREQFPLDLQYEVLNMCSC